MDELIKQCVIAGYHFIQDKIRANKAKLQRGEYEVIISSWRNDALFKKLLNQILANNEMLFNDLYLIPCKMVMLSVPRDLHCINSIPFYLETLVGCLRN